MCLVQHKICVGGRERGRKVYLLYWREVTAVSRENTLLMMETLKSIVSLCEASCKWELAKRKREWQRGIMRWSGWRRQPYIVQWGWERVVEEEKRVKYRNRSQFDSCIIAAYIDIQYKGYKNNFCLETRYWPMGGRRPIHPVQPDIHFTHSTKPKSPTVCMECSSSLLQTFTDLEKHVAPCGSVSHNPSTKVCCTIFLLQARTGYKCN